MNQSSFTYRKIEQSDRLWIDSFIKEHWGSNLVVVHSDSYYPSQLDGFIAILDDKKVGLITYQIEVSKCEVITLNSIIENCGVGTALMRLVENEAKVKDCKEIWLITTNDNLQAIGFYQKIGYQLVNIFPNAVEESRKLKPEIQLIAKNRIPIRDELKFSLVITT
jgi:N-acetylglutamate synthase-like GNAT family acetyltransferase